MQRQFKLMSVGECILLAAQFHWMCFGIKWVFEIGSNIKVARTFAFAPHKAFDNPFKIVPTARNCNLQKRRCNISQYCAHRIHTQNVQKVLVQSFHATWTEGFSFFSIAAKILSAIFALYSSGNQCLTIWNLRACYCKFWFDSSSV